MQKTNVSTALAIFFSATAVMVIGGLVVIPLVTTAMAAKPEFWYCAHGSQGRSVCARVQENCESDRDALGIEGHCHRQPIRSIN